MPLDSGLVAETLTTPPIRTTGRMALFLDMDGVLAALAPSPADVVPEPRRTAVLKRLDLALEGRLAIVSGRTLVEIDRIAEGVVASAAGVHGLERRRRDGGLDRPTASPGVAVALAAFHSFAADNPGVLVEDKVISAGLHFRQAPDVTEEAVALATGIAEDTGLFLQGGHMVVELRTPGADKGTAVAAFMTEPPFAGATPIMLGDDLTDEAAFRAASELGGFGVLVGPHRATAATHGLNGVDAVMNWLEAVADQGEAQ